MGKEGEGEGEERRRMERNGGREGERDRERRKACVPAFLSLANGKHWPNLSGKAESKAAWEV